jgi:hypothetical protein
VADALGQQSESDETNNVRAVPITIGAPDLTFAVPADGAGGGGSGREHPGLVDGTQRRPFTAFADWVDRVYLSDNATLDAGDTLLDSVTIAAQTPLDADASYTISRNVTIPQYGRRGRQVPAVCDRCQQCPAGDGRDEQRGGRRHHAGRPGFDRHSGLGAWRSCDEPGDPRLLDGQNIDDTYTAGADWSDRVYLSSDDVWDAGDRLLVTQSISTQTPLLPGAAYTINRSVTIPGDVAPVRSS